MRDATARQVRKAGRLPADGRGAFGPLARLERVFREVLAPDVPTFDVNSVQGVCFDEWTYTEGLGCFCAFTQSVEINAQLILAAAGREWPGEDHASVARQLPDKWKLTAPGGGAAGKRVFFAPGANLGWIINTDNVLRAFRSDSRWMLKPHPVTSDADVREAGLAFGVTRIYDPRSSGMALLRTCDTAGFTTASEMGLLGMLLDLPAVDFTLFEREHHGRYHPLYFAQRRLGLSAADLLNRVTNCPWSGIVPLATPDDVARERFAAYKLETLRRREDRSPLIRDAAPRPPLPPAPAGPDG